MGFIRYVSPRDPDLELPGVPAIFREGLFYVDEADLQKVSRMEFAGRPYGVVRSGETLRSFPWPTDETLARDLTDPTTAVGGLLRQEFPDRADLTAVNTGLTQLRTQVGQLVEQSGGGGNQGGPVLGTGNTSPVGRADGTLIVELPPGVLEI